jgi:hypothetical protein
MMHLEERTVLLGPFADALSTSSIAGVDRGDSGRRVAGGRDDGEPGGLRGWRRGERQVGRMRA